MKPDEVFEERRKWRASIPTMHNGAYQREWDKALEGNSLRAAIRAKCQDCMNWQSREIKLCPVVTRPLYEVRPYVKHPARRRSKTAANASICAVA